MNSHSTKATERSKLIKARLQALAPIELEIVDESHKHRGHIGAKSGASHFALTIVSAEFIGVSLIKRHQLIYQLLDDLIPQEIHALRISARTPSS